MRDTLVLAESLWAHAWTGLAELAKIQNAITVLGVPLGLFLVWRKGISVQARAVRQQNEDAYKALSRGFDAATKRADAEKARADQLAEVCAAWELKNAELARSAVADQTRYLVSVKTHAARILELERQNRELGGGDAGYDEDQR